MPTIAYDDVQQQDQWWSQMEPVLVDWRTSETSTSTQIFLGDNSRLPPPLEAFLSARLPGAMKAAYELVLRDPHLERSWVAFQQNVNHATLNRLLAIEDQLTRIERKLGAFGVTKGPRPVISPIDSGSPEKRRKTSKPRVTT